ncbi:MAG: sulfite exporter TauE/SafE family protein [Candidatus Heimdallarchaeota archaeon]|nr:MAG: sulfite exporter TauE/SafE family protein [Candidatus Heimdallarchaeota archaeon]
MDISVEIINLGLFLIITALVCEYIDSALGGGYGTILVPILLIFGFENELVVPAVLFTEILTGFSSAILHHFVGNANFEAHVNLKSGSRSFSLSSDFKTSLILAGCGVIGGAAAALIALNISKTIVKTYIGILVIIIGFLVILKFRWKFTWNRIWGIGFIAAFNKGLSGGGYGPLVSSGQVIVNRNPKEAVASTSFSEAVVSISAFTIYFLVGRSLIDVNLTLFLLIGAMASVPFAVLTVKHLTIEKLSPLIGVATICLGFFTLIKTWFW